MWISPGADRKGGGAGPGHANGGAGPWGLKEYGRAPAQRSILTAVGVTSPFPLTMLPDWGKGGTFTDGTSRPTFFVFVSWRISSAMLPRPIQAVRSFPSKVKARWDVPRRAITRLPAPPCSLSAYGRQ